MDRQQIGLKLTLDALGLPCKMDSFDDRLVLQKAVYLAQASGVLLGYHFRWYLRGPYCSALAADGFSLAYDPAQSNDEACNWELDPASKRNLKRVKLFLPTADAESSAHRLELFASVHFLVDRRQVCREPGAIARLMRKYNKDFTEEDVHGALRELTKRGLLQAGD
jgi:hypothetical protein